jgi:hypothetical protein
MSLFKCLITTVAVCWLLAACKTLEIDVERVPQLTTPTLPASPIQPPVLATPASTSTPDVNAYSGTPQEGVIYLGNVAGEVAMFMRNRGSFINPYLGSVWYFDRGNLSFEPIGYLTRGVVRSESPFDFRNFSQPHAMPAYGSEIGTIYDVKRSAKLINNNMPQTEKDFLYISLTNQVVEIDLGTSMPWRVIWQYDLSKDYPGSNDGILIDQTAGPLKMGGDRFLVLGLPPRAVLVLNAKTGKELYLGEVGNVHIDYIEKVVSCQELGSLRQKCEPSPMCEADGYMTLYAPTGELLKKPLP